MTTTPRFAELDLAVLNVRDECERVRALDLGHPNREPLPPWTPGAHIDVELPSGLVRSYSLCGEPDDRSRYQIAVLREDDGRGGSVELHETDLAGSLLRTSAPRNDFELSPAERYLFIAGGIGITPILPMIRQVDRECRPWRLMFLGRKRRSMAFLGPVAALHGDVEIVPRDERDRLDLRSLLEEEKSTTEVYCCGPNALMDAVAEIVKQTGHRLHVERFGRPDLAAVSPSVSIGVRGADDGDDAIDPDEAFEVELARSGECFTVGPGESILGRLRALRQGLNFSCTDGYCGTCETSVLGGQPDHRDTVLSEDEREASATMMICVGRSRTARLVLDL